MLFPWSWITQPFSIILLQRLPWPKWSCTHLHYGVHLWPHLLLSGDYWRVQVTVDWSVNFLSPLLIITQENIWKLFCRTFNGVSISVSYLNLRRISALLEGCIIWKQWRGWGLRDLICQSWINRTRSFVPFRVMNNLLWSSRTLTLLNYLKHVFQVLISLRNWLISIFMSYVNIIINLN